MLLLATGVGLGPTPVAASEPSPVHYIDEVFAAEQVVLTPDIPYATATNADGQVEQLALDLFEVPSESNAPRPVLLLISGGGFTGDNRKSELLVRWARSMARRGYVVATIGYRTDSDDNPLALFASVERAIEDLRAAARWFRANQASGGHAEDHPLAAPGTSVDLHIDPDRISAAGYSAGAVTAVSASWREVLHPGRRDPDGEDFESIVNPSNDGWPWEISAAIVAAGAGLGGPDAGDAPLLMFHGDADTRVAYDADTGDNYGSLGFSGTESCLRARTHGMDCLFHTFPGVAHGLFDGGAREVTIHAVSARFLSCRVGAIGPFTDVDPWVELAAGWAVRAGVVTGYPDDTFRAGRPVARGQLVAMLWRLVGSPASAAAHPFPDVPAWLAPAMDWAVEAEVITGYTDGTSRPGQSVTRAQAARMLHRTAGAVAVDDLPPFELSGVPRWAEEPVRWLVAPRAVQLLDGEGIATGYPDGTFRAGRPVTRGQAVDWLHGLALSGTAWDLDRQTDPEATACYRLGDP